MQVVTIRNCNWLLKYWECNQPVMMPPPVSEQGGDVWDYSAVYPDPVCELYGFKRADARKDAVQWSDV